MSVYSDLNASLQDIPFEKRYKLFPVLGKTLIDASALIGQFTYGSFPRNALRGPGFIDTDLSLILCL